MTSGVTGDQEHNVWHPGAGSLVPDRLVQQPIDEHHIIIPGRGNREELGLVKDGGGFHLLGDIIDYTEWCIAQAICGEYAKAAYLINFLERNDFVSFWTT